MCIRDRLNTDKTELLWVGSRHSLSQQGCCLPVLQLGPDSIAGAARDHVRLLGATLSSDLSLARRVSTVSASGFYWLRQLQRSRHSLDIESAATLVHAFVSSRVDYVTLSWRVRRKRRRTGYNECSMPLPVSSLVRRSTIEAYRSCCTLSCIGSMYPSESSTSSASWCTAV